MIISEKVKTVDSSHTVTNHVVISFWHAQQIKEKEILQVKHRISLLLKYNFHKGKKS